uniref:Uncharacterized protein n=1 Tax=Arundo donax TaxID=35708 RepID=A0A0A9HI51_ARUDO
MAVTEFLHFPFLLVCTMYVYRGWEPYVYVPVGFRLEQSTYFQRLEYRVSSFPPFTLGLLIHGLSDSFQWHVPDMLKQKFCS